MYGTEINVVKCHDHFTSPYVYVRKTCLYTQDLPKNSVAVTQKIEHHVNCFTDSCDKRDKTPDGLRRE